MRALLLDGSLRLDPDYPDPEPGPGEILVRVRKAGICRTDVELAEGYMSFRGIPGHEFVGEIAAGERKGERVVGEINCPCGECPLCRRDLGRHCPDRSVLGILGRDGAFAELLTLPEGNLHTVPPSVSDEVAVFTEPLAAALEILEQVHVEPGTRTAVLGDGKLGLLAAQVLHLAGTPVTLFGRHPEKMAPLDGPGLETVTAEEAGDRAASYDLVVEATGSWEGLEEAGRLVVPRGTIVLKSTLAAGSEFNLSPLVVNEVTVVGSRCGPFAPALRLLERGEIRTGFLLDETYRLEDWEKAFERARTRGARTVLIDMQP
jgi:alcohol dehydrogenase